MKKRILFLILIFAFFSCATSKESTFPPDSKLPTHPISVNATLYADIHKKAAESGKSITYEEALTDVPRFTVKDAFQILAKEGNVSIILEVPGHEEVTIVMNKVNWDYVFFALLKSRGLDYRWEDQAIYVFKRTE